MADSFIGEIRMFAGSYAPQGWLLCDGTTYQAQSYQALFSLIAGLFGGNGTTTFAVPNLCGNAAVGSGQGPGLTNRVLAATGGVEQVSLTEANFPSHTHALNCSSSLATQGVPNQTLALARVADTLHLYGDTSQGTDGTRFFNAAAITTSVGGNLPHDNMMPSIAVNYIICWNGIFPNFN
ncbi:phage tail protein [Phaeospirillum tilakii]|uniref:Phage tail protein n=1 Tax=Phaeospirillum tilakii TaxID=741673 RepID=A0ABW5C716_9PROT